MPKHNLRWFPDLERLLKDEYWNASAQNCLGLFVLSTYVKDYLQNAGCEIPVARILYPAEPTDRLFSLDRFFARSPKRIISGGEFLRNFQPFFDLKAPGFSKQLLVHEGFKWQSIVPNDSVELLGRVSDDEYDALLEDSVVFLNLRDAPANTTVVECIVRNTPILINPLRGVVEYLGENYPFYYSSLEEAEAKLQRPELIRETHQYLIDFSDEVGNNGGVVPGGAAKFGHLSQPRHAREPAGDPEAVRRLGSDLLLQACVQYGCFAAGVH